MAFEDENPTIADNTDGFGSELEHIRNVDYEIYQPDKGFAEPISEYSKQESIPIDDTKKASWFPGNRNVNGFEGKSDPYKGQYRFAQNFSPVRLSPSYQIVKYNAPQGEPQKLFSPSEFAQSNDTTIFQTINNSSIFDPDESKADDHICPNLIKYKGENGEVVVLSKVGIPIKEIYTLKPESTPDISRAQATYADGTDANKLKYASEDFLKDITPKGITEVLRFPSSDPSTENNIFTIKEDGKFHIVIESKHSDGTLPEIRVFESPSQDPTLNNVIHNEYLRKLATASLQITRGGKVAKQISILNPNTNEYINYPMLGHDRIDSLEDPYDNSIFETELTSPTTGFNQIDPIGKPIAISPPTEEDIFGATPPNPAPGAGQPLSNQQIF